MSPERVEEELFGSETEGVMRPGLLEHAHGGTLFLDEIADMPLTTQAKILRVLTDQSYTAWVGHGQCKVDVRVLSATRATCGGDRTRADSGKTSFYRLNSFRCNLPPLLSGSEDIRSSSAISSPASPPSGGCPRRPSPRKRWLPCRPTTGPATSGS